MTLLDDELVIDGQNLDPDVSQRVTGARLIGSMDTSQGAGSLELDVWDGDGLLLRSGALVSKRKAKTPKALETAAWARFGAMRLVFDGTLFRLAGVSGGFPTLTLTFEDEVASLMRRHERAMTVSRGSKTRAQVIGLAASKVKEIAIQYRCPEEAVKQNIEAPDDKAEEKGISPGAHLTVKGAKATAEQQKNMETVLAVADRLHAGERATLALLVACIQESTFQNLPGGDRDSQGVLQVRLSTAAGITPRTVIDPRGQVHGAVTHDVTGPIASGDLNPRDVKEVTRVFLLRGFWGKGGAIKIASDNPDMKPGEIAQQVQGSGAPTAYTQWEKEAAAILDAWGGVGEVSTLRESFQYRIGGKLKKSDQRNENYWSGTGRLADEVDGWRRFAWRNVLMFVSDEWLIARKAAFTIGPEQVYAAESKDTSQAPVRIDIGQVDVGIPLSELTVMAAARRWDGGPGKVCELVDLGPLTGKWLIWENRFDLQRDTTELTLRRPAPKGPEPAPSTDTIVTTETTPESGSPGALIVAAAEKALKYGPKVYKYRQSRPMPDTLFPASLSQAGPTLIFIDCSAFVTLLYKAANLEDPNGLGYNGSGFTGTLIANGEKTSDPQPGDLVFYGSNGPGGAPGHVGVYVGHGKVIEMGGNPGPLKLDVHYRSDFVGYYTYG